MKHRRVPGWLLIPCLCIAAMAAAQSAGRGNVAMLLNEPMSSIPDREVAIQRAVYPPGWVGARHYHTGDIFVYVLEGIFVVDVEGGERVTIGPGEVYHEAVNRNMVARNGSAEDPVTVLLFQVTRPGEPRVIITQ